MDYHASRLISIDQDCHFTSQEDRESPTPQKGRWKSGWTSFEGHFHLTARPRGRTCALRGTTRNDLLVGPTSPNLRYIHIYVTGGTNTQREERTKKLAEDLGA